MTCSNTRFFLGATVFVSQPHMALLRAVCALAHHPPCPQHCIEEVCPVVLCCDAGAAEPFA